MDPSIYEASVINNPREPTGVARWMQFDDYLVSMQINVLLSVRGRSCTTTSFWFVIMIEGGWKGIFVSDIICSIETLLTQGIRYRHFDHFD